MKRKDKKKKVLIINIIQILLIVVLVYSAIHIAIWYKNNEMKIVMYEGKKRQIRKMCWLAGLRVIKLKRIRIGKLLLGDLNPGEYRALTLRDLKELSQT